MARQGPWYNTQFLLYPRPLTCEKEFFAVYMCQLWALHVVIKRQFFYIYICSFSTKFILQMHIIAQAYFTVLQKRTEAILEYHLRFQFGN